MIGSVLLALPAAVAPGAPPNVWWYRTPAAKYWAGLPLSNGRLAAMVLGRVRDESIPINDESLWTGSPYDPNNPDGPAILQEVRKLLLDGKLVEAQQLCQKMLSRPLSVQHYQPLGELRLRFDGQAEPSAYRRELDMDSAIARVTYQVGGVHYTREVFASFPDQVLVVQGHRRQARQASPSPRDWPASSRARTAPRAPDSGITMDGRCRNRRARRLRQSSHDSVPHALAGPRRR